MPTKRKRRTRNIQNEITEIEWARINDLPPPEGANKFSISALKWCGLDKRQPRGRPTLRELWTSHGPEVIERFAIKHPGTRPSLFWAIDAPGQRKNLESQAAYLKRHGLLLPGEEERLI
ncbi:hypothetical protein ACFL6E_06280 [Candidatus Neomarinimicrobiota bacterium]